MLEHLDLLDEVFLALMNMGKTVDLLTGQVRSGGHQVLVLGIFCQLIGHSCGIYMALNQRMVDDGCAFDQLAHHIYFDVSFTETLSVLFTGFHVSTSK